ncbi:MAG: hypothetical protein VW455_09595 [Nitrospinota bacterium]
MTSNNLQQTRELLLKVWTILLMGLYGVGFQQEKMLALQGQEPKADILPDVAKLLFFALMFVAFLMDIVEMREDRDKAFRFLVLSLVLGGISATISALQYHAWSWLFAG